MRDDTTKKSILVKKIMYEQDVTCAQAREIAGLGPRMRRGIKERVRKQPSKPAHRAPCGHRITTKTCMMCDMERANEASRYARTLKVKRV